LKHQIITLNNLIDNLSVFKTSHNNDAHIFNELSNFKKVILSTTTIIRNKYIKRKIYIELTYDTTKNSIEIRARKREFNEIILILNDVLKSLIISTMQIKSINQELTQDKVLTLNLYKDSNDKTFCKICLETLLEKNLIKLSYCGDVYCKDCIKNLILNQINAQPVADLPLKCSICNDLILNSDVFRIFNQKERRFLYYQLTKYFMTKENKDQDLRWCENPNCQYVYRKSQFLEINTNIRYCPNCLKTFCMLCSNELNDNMHNQECKTLILKNLDINNRNWIIKNTNNCPKCNEMYEKSIGCNHMICKKCKPEIHFCYICGEILDSRKYIHKYFKLYLSTKI